MRGPCTLVAAGLLLAQAAWAQVPDTCSLTGTVAAPGVSRIRTAAAVQRFLDAQGPQRDPLRIDAGTTRIVRTVLLQQRILVCRIRGASVQYTLHVEYDVHVSARDGAWDYQLTPTVRWQDGRVVSQPGSGGAREDDETIRCAFEAAWPYHNTLARQLVCRLRQAVGNP